MGRRSRKRGVVAPSRAREERPVPAPAPRRRGTRPTREDLPAPPWAPFPLVELAVLVAIVCLVAGFVSGGDSGGLLIACGLVVGSLAGLEVVIREHFAGVKSHTVVLALVPAVVAMAVAYFTGAPQWAVVAAGVPVLALAAWGLQRAFRRRTGGAGFR